MYRLDLMRTGSKGYISKGKMKRRLTCDAVNAGPYNSRRVLNCVIMPQIKIRKYVIGQRHSYSGKSMQPAKLQQGTKEKKRKQKEKVGCR